MAHPSQHLPQRVYEPSSEAAAALHDARQAARAQLGRFDVSHKLLAELRRQRRENHFTELIENVVAVAASE